MKFLSRKFIAFVLSLSSITTLLMTLVLSDASLTLENASVMSLGMITLGALSIGYVVSQAALEKFLETVKKDLE